MLPCFRWFGPDEPVSLMDIRQAGCEGIVTALHQMAPGEVWQVSDIKERQRIIEAENGRYSPLLWQVVESLPVHEDIKKGLPSRDKYIENYLHSLRNLAKCGVNIVCYNFMPVLDWSRTDVGYELSTGARTLRFDWQDFASFDLFILKRPSAGADYAPEEIAAVKKRFDQKTKEEIRRLSDNVLLGLPGATDSFSLSNFQSLLDAYQDIDATRLTENLHYFIKKVAPEAEKLGIGLCIHPDDPPRPLLGLPRVVSTEKDLQNLMNAAPIRANGITFCTGSLGVREENDLPGMITRLGDRIHFVHLRSTLREDDPRNFHEAPHLAGNVDMVAVISALVKEESRRSGRAIPMRPDHGFQILDDLRKKTYPGYSAIGRLKGLAEIRGVELAVSKTMKA